MRKLVDLCERDDGPVEAAVNMLLHGKGALDCVIVCTSIRGKIVVSHYHYYFHTHVYLQCLAVVTTFFETQTK